MNPGLVHDLAGHALAHTLYSHIRRGKRGISRRKARKIANRKRRFFVDNIIMHHKRLHDRNRELLISKARSRALARRRAAQSKPEVIKQALLQKSRDDASQWRDRTDLKEKGLALRGRVDARRLRARSRWLSVAAASGGG